MKILKFKLNKIRAEKGLSIYKISKDTGIAEMSLKKINDNISRQVKLETIETLCNYLDISLVEFMDFE